MAMIIKMGTIIILYNYTIIGTYESMKYFFSQCGFL